MNLNKKSISNIRKPKYPFQTQKFENPTFDSKIAKSINFVTKIVATKKFAP